MRFLTPMFARSRWFPTRWQCLMMWLHGSVIVPCPDCYGRSPACDRCNGQGRLLVTYHDGEPRWGWLPWRTGR
jgi:hypothetical protein